MSRLLLILPLWIALTTVSAQEKCSSNCICAGDIKSLSIPEPKGFTLTTACDVYDADYKSISSKSAKTIRPDHFGDGYYYYRGKATLTGKIMKFEDGPNGTMVHFYPQNGRSDKRNRLSSLQQFVLLNDIIIADSKRIGTINLATSETVSWCADATLTIHELSILVADTCATGVEAGRYDVVSVGKYRKC